MTAKSKTKDRVLLVLVAVVAVGLSFTLAAATVSAANADDVDVTTDPKTEIIEDNPPDRSEENGMIYIMTTDGSDIISDDVTVDGPGEVVSKNGEFEGEVQIEVDQSGTYDIWVNGTQLDNPAEVDQKEVVAFEEKIDVADLDSTNISVNRTYNGDDTYGWFSDHEQVRITSDDHDPLELDLESMDLGTDDVVEINVSKHSNLDQYIENLEEGGTENVTWYLGENVKIVDDDDDPAPVGGGDDGISLTVIGGLAVVVGLILVARN